MVGKLVMSVFEYFCLTQCDFLCVALSESPHQTGGLGHAGYVAKDMQRQDYEVMVAQK